MTTLCGFCSLVLPLSLCLVTSAALLELSYSPDLPNETRIASTERIDEHVTGPPTSRFYRLEVTGTTIHSERFDAAYASYSEDCRDEALQVSAYLSPGTYLFRCDTLLTFDGSLEELLKHDFESEDLPVPSEFLDAVHLSNMSSWRILVVQDKNRTEKSPCQSLTEFLNQHGHWLNGEWKNFLCSMQGEYGSIVTRDYASPIYFHVRGDSVARQIFLAMCTAVNASVTVSVAEDLTGRGTHMQCCDARTRQLCFTYESTWLSLSSFSSASLVSSQYCTIAGKEDFCRQSMPDWFLNSPTKPFLLLFMGSHDARLGCNENFCRRIRELSVATQHEQKLLFGTTACVETQIPDKFGAQFILRNNARVASVNRCVHACDPTLKFVNLFFPSFMLSRTAYGDAVHFNPESLAKACLHALLEMYAH